MFTTRRDARASAILSVVLAAACEGHERLESASDDTGAASGAVGPERGPDGARRPATRSTPEVDQGAEPDVVFRIGRGEHGVNFGGEAAPEGGPWGPLTLRADADGSFWILDQAADRLLNVSDQGKVLRIVSYADHTHAAMDFELAKDGFALLYRGPEAPAVVDLDRNGVRLATRAVPAGLQSQVAGLLRHAGEAMLYLGGVHVVAPVASGSSGAVRAAADLPLAVSGRYLALDVHRERDDLDLSVSSATLHVNGKAVQIAVNGWIGSIRVVHTFEDGGLLLAIEDVQYSPVVEVDTSLWRIDAKGDVVGKAHVPYEESYTDVDSAIAVQPDGSAYVLLTREDGAEVRRLSFSTSYQSPIALRAPLAARVSVSDAVAACISRQAVITNAQAYVDARVTINAKNSTGACDGRGRPESVPKLTGAKTAVIVGIPYDWAGTDSIAEFRDFMASGSQAGDVDTQNPFNGGGNMQGVEKCSKGVDCSGFVSQAWGRGKGGRLGTGQMAEPANTCSLSKNDVLQPGDVLLRTAKPAHVVLFHKWSTKFTSAVFYESASRPTTGRVVVGPRPIKDLVGFEPRRYLNICGGTCE